MQKDIMEREIAEIIKGFRQDSIEIEMNQEHVHKWISQFSPDTQNIILEETLHILKEWYFPKDKINLFLDKMMDYLKSENENATDEEPMKDIYFWNIQESGKSQSQLPEISAYVEKLEEIKGKKVYYCFRNAGYKYTAGIFSNLVNRDIVEEEFLKKGIAITQNIQEHKGLYPLGYNLTPSLGFGSFCATDLNISNTCPIVLWWGNVIEKGNELDCWYPLLPRRISAKDINPFDADWTLQEAEDDGYDDVFDTCPDCGCGISLRNDGGNGFCIDCAWNH